VYALGGGLVRVRARYDELQFLLGRPNDLRTRLISDSFVSGATYRAHVEPEAPDGTPYEHLGGDPPANLAPPPGLSGPTRLEITAQHVGGGIGGDEIRTYSYVLDCDGNGSDGVADPRFVCEQLVADRYALLPPVSGGLCSLPAEHPTLELHGTVLGASVRRNWGGCGFYEGGIVRWLELLDVPA
jgi:hypothetical protein